MLSVKADQIKILLLLANLKGLVAIRFGLKKIVNLSVSNLLAFSFV